VALSHPLFERWLVDVYAGLWLFGANTSYYPGTAVREQAPLGTLQAHISYSLSLKAWAAFDATWYAGGQTSVDDVPMGDRALNSRVGATLVFPAGTRHAIRVAFSTGAIIRSGADFTTLSLGWQAGWLDRPSAQRP
jgi:hypothetical protein